MSTYTIENETNNITLHATQEEAQAAGNSEQFSTMEELAALAENWPAARLIEIWNSIPGNPPVKKFTDRKTAVSRIWKAIQTLEETNAPADQAPAPVAEAFQIEEPEASTMTPGTEPAQKPPTLEADVDSEAESVEEPDAEVTTNETQANVSEQAPDVVTVQESPTKKATRSEKTPTGEPKATREGSKTSTVVDLMKREGGVSLKGIMEATGWQAHSVRGFVSGTLTKKMGLAVVSAKAQNGERTYSITT